MIRKLLIVTLLANQEWRAPAQTHFSTDSSMRASKKSLRKCMYYHYHCYHNHQFHHHNKFELEKVFKCRFWGPKIGPPCPFRSTQVEIMPYELEIALHSSGSYLQDGWINTHISTPKALVEQCWKFIYKWTPSPIEKHRHRRNVTSHHSLSLLWQYQLL